MPVFYQFEVFPGKTLRSRKTPKPLNVYSELHEQNHPTINPKGTGCSCIGDEKPKIGQVLLDL